MEDKVNQKGLPQKLIFYCSMITMTIYIVWRIIFTIPTSYGPVALIFGILLIASESIAAIEAYVSYFQIEKGVLPQFPDIEDSMYPHVDVLIATHNEPVDLLYKTVNACTYLHYPDKSKVHIYLCDDKNRQEMMELADKLGVGYFGLTKNEHAKAGNLNNALRNTDSPLIVTLDADMIPHHNFLMKTVPYFFLPQMKKNEDGKWIKKDPSEIDPDEKIGFIQTPQSFYNPDLFQFNLFSEDRIPNEQDFFFKDINVGRNATNSTIYAGSNTLISRQALEDVDYIATNSITEDFSTGIKIQRSGYRTYAIPEVLAHGLAPDTVKSLLSQRERWGRGCVQSLRNEHIVKDKKLKVSTKISYIASLTYWWSFFRRMIFVMSPILSVLFNLLVVEAQTWQVLLFWLPAYLLFNKAMKVMSGNIRSQHWSDIIDTIIFPYLIGPILAETFHIKKRKFVVTTKDKIIDPKKRSLFYTIPHILLLIVSLLSLFIGVTISINTGELYNLIVMYWLVINTKNLIFAIFFMYGRTNFRMADRFYFETPVQIKYKDRTLDAVTNDVSETGLAFSMDTPEFIPIGSLLDIRISTELYSASLTAEVVHVNQVDDKWKYSMRITDIGEDDKKEYMQIVFDRRHSLPDTLQNGGSLFDDFNMNISGRAKEKASSVRKYARIVLNIPFRVDGQSVGEVKDFNYLYSIIDSNIDFKENEILEVKLTDDLTIIAKPMKKEDESMDRQLFEILNGKDIASNPDSGKILKYLQANADEPIEKKVAVDGKVVSMYDIEYK